MPQSDNKPIKKIKKTKTSTKKVPPTPNNVEEEIFKIITNLQTLEKNIQQETFDDSEQLKKKYIPLLYDQFEQYQKTSKKVDKLSFAQIDFSFPDQ